MSKKVFSESDIKILQQNPNVVRITAHIINLSAEFKKEAYIELLQGKSLHDILWEHGIDPSMLGEGRIAAMKSGILKTGIEGKGFTDINTVKSDFLTNTRIRQLELALKYKDQEIEFLKKIVSLGEAEGQR